MTVTWQQSVVNRTSSLVKLIEKKNSCKNYVKGDSVYDSHVATVCCQQNKQFSKAKLEKKNSCKNYVKVTVDLRGVFWGKQYSALCINGNM